MRLPKKGAEDRRIQKTQNLLREALVSLIAEKPYDSIVVKEILDRANVGRSTFYMHFRDKDDLLVSGIHDMLGPVPFPARSPGKARTGFFGSALQSSSTTTGTHTPGATESGPEAGRSCMSICEGCSRISSLRR